MTDEGPVASVRRAPRRSRTAANTYSIGYGTQPPQVDLGRIVDGLSDAGCLGFAPASTSSGMQTTSLSAMQIARLAELIRCR